MHSGAPVVMSAPHFYQAEETIVEAVMGMKPSRQQHQTAIDIHPVGNPGVALTSPALTHSPPACSCREEALSPTRWRRAGIAKGQGTISLAGLIM